MFWPEWAGILCSDLSELVSYVLNWVSWSPLFWPEWAGIAGCLAAGEAGHVLPVPVWAASHPAASSHLPPVLAEAHRDTSIIFQHTRRDWSTRFIRSYLHNSDPPGLMTTRITNFRIQLKFGEAFWIMTHFLLEIKESGGFWFVKLYGWAASRDTVSLNF